MELCYLPDADIMKDGNYPGWESDKKPTNLFTYAENHSLNERSTRIKAGWRLNDKRQKPDHKNGFQMYDNDVLKDVIVDLRLRGVIERWDGKDQGSRFNISNNELQKEEVMNAFAKVLGVNPKNIRLPLALEYNVIACVHHREWGISDSYEWFDDFAGDNSYRLLGGASDSGGISYVNYSNRDSRKGYVGFRIFVDLPQN